MKIVPDPDGLSIVPETSFEEEYLRNYQSTENLQVFIKTGEDLKDIKGLKILWKLEKDRSSKPKRIYVSECPASVDKMSVNYKSDLLDNNPKDTPWYDETHVVI
jgi:hypothetical protein